MVSLDIKVKWAYVEFKRKLRIIMTLYFLAVLSGVSLILASEFIYNNTYLKLWSVVLVIILFFKVSYDTRVRLRTEYAGMTVKDKPPGFQG